MSLVYDFKFGPTCDGLDAVVTDAAGAEVTGSPATLDADGSAQLTLDEGAYLAVVQGPTADGRGHLATVGVLNVAASIDAAALLPAP
jgi:hypothetical protein